MGASVSRYSNISRNDFPDDFIFGTATSAYQHEGSATKDGRGPSVWDAFTLDTPGKIVDGSNGNEAAGMYTRYKEDIKIMKNMGSDLIQSVNFSDMKCDVPELNGDNYKVWKERILLHLGRMDIDYAIRKDEPPAITKTSIPDDVYRYEKWERSNRLSIMFIKTKISAGIRVSVEQYGNVRALLKTIDDQFVTSDKALASTLIMQFSSLKLTGIRGVRKHIIRMKDIAAQLKALEVEMSESFLVHFILCTLPPQYGPFKISYNTHKDKWSINDLMTMCVQEEGSLAMEEGEKVNLATIEKKKNLQAKEKGKDKIPSQEDIKKCFFCKKKGHKKRECTKLKIFLEKKGIAKPMDQ